MNIQYLKDNNMLIFEAYRGSYAYNTYIEGVSDKDMFGVYVQSLEDVIGVGRYIPQISDEKGDCVYYELGRFLELLKVNNPNILEALAVPKRCLIYKHPVFDLILENKDKFITKLCKNSFGGYATAQFKKAKGQDKMMNWEKDKVTRKVPLDFCNVLAGGGTYPLKKHIVDNKLDQKLCGLVKMPNARDMYALYYDHDAHFCFSKYLCEEDKKHNIKIYKEQNKAVGCGFKGITKEDGDGKILSNELRLSSVSKKKSSEVECYVSYNKDSYTSHCRDYRQYREWLEKRNKQRWVDVENHGQKIDGKNLLHCMRLINMSIEIASGKGIIIERPEAKFLIDIRKGKYNLTELLNSVEDKIKESDKLFEKSSLPEKVDENMINELVIKIRKEMYNLM